MKAKIFIPATVKYKNSKKAADYWSTLFVCIIFLALMSCFLIANHTDRTQVKSLSDRANEITPMKIDTSHSENS